ETIPQSLIEALRIPDPVKSVLRARAIVMPVAESKVPLFGTIHRVLADFLRSHSENPDEDLRILAQALISTMTMESSSDPTSWPLMDACRPHAERIVERLLSKASQENASEAVILGLYLSNLSRTQ